MNQEEIKQLLILLENFDKGGEKEAEALEAFLDSKGLSYEDALKYESASAEAKPETPVEERQQRKGKAVDDVKATRDALDLDNIAKAFGVDLKKAQEEGELEQGELGSYLDQRGVFARVPGESNEAYKDRMVNAFETLGLNFNSKEDRALVANSLAHHNQMDSRQAIKEEAGSGPSGFITRLLAPRTFEKAERDIMTGEGGEDVDYFNFIIDNAKELGLDLGENLAMTAGAPVTGVLKAIANSKKVQNAYKAFKKGKKILDGRTNANKALKSTGAAAGVIADAAAVPFTFEGLDALAFDDPENTRSEFDLGDALLGTAINIGAPLYLRKQQNKNKRMFSDQLDEFGQAAEDLKKVAPNLGLKKYIMPFVTNKLGTADATRSNQFIEETGIRENQINRDKKAEKKNQTKAEKIDKWRRGLAIPMPGDKDFEEYQKWLDQNRRGLAKYM